jgi:hypothetical protein
VIIALEKSAFVPFDIISDQADRERKRILSELRMSRIAVPLDEVMGLNG